MFTLTTAAARRKFSELVNRVWYTKERAMLTRYGKALVAIVPIEDLATLKGIGKADAARQRTRSLKSAKAQKK